jgi:predicted GIY-YIG superfamily endonuclease
MWYVYIIRSINFPEQEYIGATADLKRRMPDHNAGKSTHTAKFKPWKLVWYCAFPDKYKALEFEKYLKSHSGRAFAKKRLCCLMASTTPPLNFARNAHDD